MAKDLGKPAGKCDICGKKAESMSHFCEKCAIKLFPNEERKPKTIDYRKIYAYMKAEMKKWPSWKRKVRLSSSVEASSN